MKDTVTGKIRLFVSDLDGTLLNSEKDLSPRTIDVIGGAISRGIRFTFCTARPYAGIKRYADQLRLREPVVLFNGVCIADGSTGAIIGHSPIPSGLLARICAFLEEMHIGYSVFCGGGILANAPAYKHIITLPNRISTKKGNLPYPTSLLLDISQLEQETSYKLRISNASAAELDQISGFLRHCPELCLQNTEPGQVDISLAGLNKGTGVLSLAAHLDIPPEQICAFGDYESDLPMFRAAGISVAMGNAADSVKDAATFITGSNEEDGVAEFIARWFGRPL